MEPQMPPFEMSHSEHLEPMLDHGIAPGGCFPAHHLPSLPYHPDWPLHLIDDHLPWDRPIPVEADGAPA